MYIDIHSHAYWKPTPFVTRFLMPEELIAAQDKNGIEKGVLLPGCSLMFFAVPERFPLPLYRQW